VRATGEVALAQVSLPNAASDEVYDRLAMRVEWSGRPASSWQLAFSDVVLSRNGGAWPAGGLTKIEVGRDGSALERVVVEADLPEDYFPHYLPGQNPYLREFAENHGLPYEATRGGAETMYPEYVDTIREMGE
jgi:hypothetical protein